MLTMLALLEVLVMSCAAVLLAVSVWASVRYIKFAFMPKRTWIARELAKYNGNPPPGWRPGWYKPRKKLGGGENG
jgi:hypothetical protein